jgi:hypothetical protein
MISYMISYHMKHINLTVLYPKAVSCQVEGIALCLWPPALELTLPLNAAECPKLSFAALAEDQVVQVFQDGIQLPCRPLEAALGGEAQLLPVVIADPSCQFRRQPLQPLQPLDHDPISCNSYMISYKYMISYMLSCMISYMIL